MRVGLVGLLTAAAIGDTSVDEYIASLPFKVSIGNPRVWPGTENGPVACFDEEGLTAHVLAALGAKPAEAETLDNIADYFLEYGRSLKDMSPGTILGLILPSGLPISLKLANRERMSMIRDRARERTREQRHSIPFARNANYLLNLVNAYFEDEEFGPGLQRLVQAASGESEEDKKIMEGLEQTVEAALKASVMAYPEPPGGILGLYDPVQRAFLLSKTMGSLLMGFASVQSGGLVKLSAVSPGVNLADMVCRGMDQALDDADVEFATRIRCALQTAFTSMMACGGAPIDCSEDPLARQNYRSYQHCEKVDGLTDAPMTMLTPEKAEAALAAARPGTVPEEWAQTEGQTYLFAWRGMQAGGQWTHNATCKKDPSFAPDFEVIPGWSVTYDMWIRPEGSSSITWMRSEAYPFAMLAQNKADPCRFMILNRGTATEWEWYADIDSVVEPLILERHPEITVKAHRGMVNLMNSVWPGARDFILGDILPQCPNGVDVFVSGHSLGGGMGLMWATKLADLLYDKLKPDAYVNAVLWSGLRALTQDSVDAIRAALPINLRAIVMSLDLITGMPCSGGKGMQLCNSRTAVGINGDGIAEPFGSPWNEVRMSPEYMMELHPNNFYYGDKGFLVIEALSFAVNMPAPLNVGPSHNCAPECLGSVLACSDNPVNHYGCDYEGAIPCADGQADLSGGNSRFPAHYFISTRCHNSAVKVGCKF